MNKTNRNLWIAFIGEAKANRMYTAYALKAMEEGHPEIAQIFFEVAGAETAHAISHLHAMDEIKSTYENLKHVVESESYESGQMYPKMIQEALAEGRTQAAESFRLAMERENYHLGLFQETLRQLEKKLAVSEKRDRTASTTSPRSGVTERPVPARTEQADLQSVHQPASVAALGEVRGEKARIIVLQRIREVVFGMQDGLISTVALVSSVAVATTERYIVIVAGLTTALAGMISMATGSYLSSKAEKELHTTEIEKEARELEEKPEEEMAELIEIYLREGLTLEEAERLAERMAQDKQLWLKTLAEKELGLSPEMTESPSKDAMTMGVSFILGAAVPILPYFFISSNTVIPISIGITILTLFGVGVVKSKVTRRNPMRSGLEIVLIGTFSALLGYLIGTISPRLLGISIF
ncbi:MAG: VIT1/CCC1 transporter family protein [Nitrospira sp.]|nr:VIT1/CCC1 transporter family protein [Nitrospira sp.]